jgi:hypothetical protein
LFSKNILKKMFTCYPPKMGAIIRNKKQGVCQIEAPTKKTCNPFKNIYLKRVLVGSFGGKLELKGNNFTHLSKNCFSL